MIKLWIDDLRPAPEGYVWCKSIKSALICLILIGICFSTVGCIHTQKTTIEYVEVPVEKVKCCGTSGVEYAPQSQGFVAIICSECGKQLGSLPVAKEEVYVPYETIIEKEVIVEVPVEVIVEKEVVVEKIVEIPIEKEVIKEIEVIVEKEVIIEVIREVSVCPEFTYCNDYNDYCNFVVGKTVTNLVVSTGGYIPTSSGNYWEKADIIINNGETYAKKNYYSNSFTDGRVRVELKGGFSISQCAVTGTIIERTKDSYGTIVLVVDATNNLSITDILYPNK